MRRQQNKDGIELLMNEGVMVSDPEQIERLINNYYTSLYNQDFDRKSDPMLLNNVVKCNKKESDTLVAPILGDELWETLK